MTDSRPGLEHRSHPQAGTLFAALYGTLTPRLDRDPATERDTYIQFHDRAQAMGWLDDLWAMNDAGQGDPREGREPSPATWFQAEAIPAAIRGRSLPVQPFLRCAGDVTDRIGALNLDGLQVLLPVHIMDVSQRPELARMPALSTAAWFSDIPAWTSVTVTVASGRSVAMGDGAERIHDALHRYSQEAFVYGGQVDRTPIDCPVPDAMWGGPVEHRTSFVGELIEWSLDAIGWLGALVGDIAARENVDVPLLLTVERDHR